MRSVDVKLVIAADENNICQTSSAVLAGIAAGAWVLRPECKLIFFNQINFTFH